jgi:hypothetical protein
VLIGIGFMGIGISTIADNYPVISCIMMMEDSLNVEGNKMPFTKESQREAIQWRCVKENIDFNASYQSLLEFKG